MSTELEKWFHLKLLLLSRHNYFLLGCVLCSFEFLLFLLSKTILQGTVQVERDARERDSRTTSLKGPVKVLTRPVMGQEEFFVITAAASLSDQG